MQKHERFLQYKNMRGSCNTKTSEVPAMQKFERFLQCKNMRGSCDAKI
jgi:hypothetical protein